MNKQELIEYLVQEKWDLQNPKGNFLLSAHKTYPDGLDVIISLKQEPNGYFINSSSEHRTSGPCDNCEGESENLSGALDIFKSVCADWDINQ